MRTLAEDQADVLKFYQIKQEGWIGVACDKCGHELKAERGLLLSNPPQQNIWCDGCGWRGRRVV